MGTEKWVLKKNWYRTLPELGTEILIFLVLSTNISFVQTTGTHFSKKNWVPKMGTQKMDVSAGEVIFLIRNFFRCFSFYLRLKKNKNIDDAKHLGTTDDLDKIEEKQTTQEDAAQLEEKKTKSKSKKHYMELFEEISSGSYEDSNYYHESMDPHLTKKEHKKLQKKKAIS